MNNSPKALFLVTEDWFFLSHRLSMAKHLSENGFQVAIACRISTHADSIRELGFELFEVPFARESIHPSAVLRAARCLKKVIRQYRPDIVLPGGLRLIILNLIATLNRPRLRVLNLMVGRGSLFTPTVDKSLRLILARKVLGITLRLAFRRKSSYHLFLNRDDLMEFTISWGCGRAVSFALPGPGIDTTAWKPSEEPKSDPPVILYAGRIIRDKGIGELVEASRLLKLRGVDHTLIIAGRLDACNPNCLTERDMQNWVKSHGINWLGHSDDVLSLLSQSNIVAMPSYLEGFGRVILEAGLAKRAVVTCDTVGCRDAVKHMDNGLLVPPRNANALASALELLLLDENLRRTLARRHYQRTCTEFSNNVILPIWLQICQAITSRNPAAAISRLPQWLFVDDSNSGNTLAKHQ
jgi:glycosyltransferase involved in cell wall biosynthesis